MKKFWQEEDERNGGVSDVSRCIAEIERLQKELDDLAADNEDDDNGCRCGKCSNSWCFEHPAPPYGDYLTRP
jgi:hypothetical protein